MISISKHPLTKLDRKLDFDFLWQKKLKCIKIRCYISHYDERGELVQNSSVKDSIIDIVANTKEFVFVETGKNVSKEELTELGLDSQLIINKYDYYTKHVGSKPIILEDIINGLILQADSKMEFNM